jgi:hypothetical protein
MLRGSARAEDRTASRSVASPSFSSRTTTAGNASDGEDLPTAGLYFLLLQQGQVIETIPYTSIAQFLYCAISTVRRRRRSRRPGS